MENTVGHKNWKFNKYGLEYNFIQDNDNPNKTDLIITVPKGKSKDWNEINLYHHYKTSHTTPSNLEIDEVTINFQKEKSEKIGTLNIDPRIRSITINEIENIGTIKILDGFTKLQTENGTDLLIKNTQKNFVSDKIKGKFNLTFNSYNNEDKFSSKLSFHVKNLSCNSLKTVNTVFGISESLNVVDQAWFTNTEFLSTVESQLTFGNCLWIESLSVAHLFGKVTLPKTELRVTTQSNAYFPKNTKKPDTMSEFIDEKYKSSVNFIN